MWDGRSGPMLRYCVVVPGPSYVNQCTPKRRASTPNTIASGQCAYERPASTSAAASPLARLAPYVARYT
jgi:hypothetical protein